MWSSMAEKEKWKLEIEIYSITYWIVCQDLQRAFL